MKISITARHLKLTDGLADYINKKVDRLQKYLNSLLNAQVKLDVEKYRQTVEIILHSEGNIFKTKVTSQDMYAAVDIAAGKLENQLRRYKEKVKKRHLPSRRTAQASPGLRRREAMPRQEFAEEPSESYEFEKQVLPVVIPSRVGDLLRQNERKFMLFINAQTNDVNLIYEKEDGRFGIVEPE